MKQNFIKWIFGALLFAFPMHALAVDNELQSWNVVTLRVDAPHKLRLYAEVQPRTGLNSHGMERMLLRPAIGYQLTPNVSVWQGYAWVPGFRDNAPDEQRIFQQLLIENKVKRFKISNRTRLEQRWVDNSGGTAVRVRHHVKVQHPIGDSEKWAWVGHNELFWNLNDTRRGPQAGFDQNRVFAGVNRKLGDAASAEAGYMMNYVNRYSPTVDKLNHAVMMSLNLHLR